MVDRRRRWRQWRRRRRRRRLGRRPSPPSFPLFFLFFSFGVLLISSSATEFQFQSLGPVPGPVPGPLSVDAIFRMNESVAEEIDDLCRFFGIFFLFTESDLRGPP